MCGIYGFAGFEDGALLGRMGDAIRHRGPDGEGRLLNGRFAMGMRRLAIIDLSTGDQPIWNEDRTLAVVYNGEIYNYVELAEELAEKGHVFRTHSDTEVIVHAYEEWGRDCVTRFNGMFAFALHNLRTGDTFFARDRCGQKPFYWWRDGGRFLFGSEVKAILECDHVPRECNVPAIDAFLALRYVPEPRTMFRGVFTLPAAHWMFLPKDGEPQIQRYWDVPVVEPGQQTGEEESLERIEAEFRKAVKIAMRSDVPVGAYLSAGVDSSLVVALMREHNPRIQTYSIGFNSPIDETRDAAETARLLGTEHHEIHCRHEDFASLPKIVWHMDRPVGDALIIAFNKLAQRTAQDLKVTVGGEGADEIFAGYSFHKVIQMAEFYHQLVPGFVHRGATLPILRATPVNVLDRFFHFPADLGSEGKARFLEFFERYGDRTLFGNYVALKTVFGTETRRDLYTDALKGQANEEWVPPVRIDRGSFHDRMLALQWDEWLQDWSIIRQDKNTMAHSLEIRLPFLDHNLIEAGFRVPPRLKGTWTRDKIIERRLAAKLLPPAVTNRPKNPFFFPMEFFFEHPEFHQLLSETLTEERVKARGYFRWEAVKALLDRMETREFLYLKQVMCLVILELWHQIFIDRKRLW